MRPLRLDFERAPHMPGRPGWIVLLTGVLITVAITIWFQQIRTETKSIQARLELLGDTDPSRLKRASDSPADQAHQDEIQRATLIVRQLELPWGSLFAALEAAHGDDVTLVALQPDSQKNLVHITVEASDKAAMLAYLRRLSGGGVFSAAYLLSHQEQPTDPSRPLLFTVEASFAP